MKVNIITPYDSANYGAFLQAYASKIFLENLGFDVCFLRWRDEDERRKEFFNVPKGFKAKIRYYQKYRFLKNKYKVFNQAKEIFNVVEANQIKQSEMVLIGSDEVWNIKSPKFQKECFYALNINNDVKKLAYAPSAADCTIGDFEKFPNLSKGMKDIILVGARDKKTQRIYNSVTGKKTEIVCDPTLLIDMSEWEFPEIKNIYGKYILVYAYSIPKEQRKMLKKVAKERNCKLIAVGLYKSWCDMNICCNPLEFNGLIKNAEAVYTTTFHGSIFTLINHKKCVIRADSEKLKDLLERLDVNFVKEPNDVDAVLMDKLLFTERNYDRFETELKKIRERSRNTYLRKLGDITNEIYN